MSWAAPDDDGGSPITDYDLRWRKTSATTWDVLDDSGDNAADTDTSHTISNLDNNSEYEVQVRAQNSVGAGAWSDSHKATPMEADTAPAFESDAQINDQPYTVGAAVSVELPEASDGNGDLSYSIAGLPAGLSLSGRTISGAPTVSQAQASYTYTVADSDTNTAATDTDTLALKISVAPAKAPAVSAKPGNAQVSLTWTAPADTGISGWETSSNDGTDWAAATVTGTATLTTTVDDLTNGTEYTLRIRAFTGTADDPLYGGASDAVTETPAAPPGAPTGLALAPGDGQITATWTAPASDGGSDIIDYDVRWCDASKDCTDDDNWDEPDTDSTSTDLSATITGLTNGTSYRVQVRAQNAASAGAWSAGAQTSAGLPGRPGAPTLTPGDGQIAVSWTAPAANGSAIIDYDVRWRKTGQAPVPDWSEPGTDATSTDLTATITGLDNDDEYEVQVRAQNSVGAGAWSDSHKATPVETDTAPAFDTNASINDQPYTVGSAVSVELPEASGGNGTLSYTMSPTLPAGLSLSGRTISGAPTVSQEQASYTYTVSDSDANTAATDTDTLALKISVAPAKAPTPSAALGDGEVTLTWDKPADTGISGWQTKTDSGDWADATVSGTSELSTTVDTLTNGTAYSFRIRAHAGSGADRVFGDPSDAVSETPATTPGKPDKPDLSVGDEKLVVTWTAPDKRGSDIVDYDLRWRKTDATTWDGPDTDETSTDLTATITDLDNNFEYEVQVRAENSVGAGDWSESQRATPKATHVEAGNPPASDSVWTATLGAAALSNGMVGYRHTPSEGTLSDRTFTLEEKEYSVVAAAIDPDPDDNTLYFSVSSTGALRSDFDGLALFIGARSFHFDDARYNPGIFNWQVGAFSMTDGESYAVAISGSSSTAPGKPRGLTLAAGDQKVDVSWSAPLSHGGLGVSDYDVRYRPSGTSAWTELDDTTDSTDTSATLTGLTNDIVYEVQARAENQLGAGAWSDAAQATPDIAFPYGARLTAAEFNINGVKNVGYAATGGGSLNDLTFTYEGTEFTVTRLTNAGRRGPIGLAGRQSPLEDRNRNSTPLTC